MEEIDVYVMVDDGGSYVVSDCTSDLGDKYGADARRS